MDTIEYKKVLRNYDRKHFKKSQHKISWLAQKWVSVFGISSFKTWIGRLDWRNRVRDGENVPLMQNNFN